MKHSDTRIEIRRHCQDRNKEDSTDSDRNSKLAGCSSRGQHIRDYVSEIPEVNNDMSDAQRLELSGFGPPRSWCKTYSQIGGQKSAQRETGRRLVGASRMSA